MTINSYSNSARGGFKPIEDSGYFKKTMMWLGVAFLLAAIGTFLIGPFIPVAFINPLAIGMSVAMLALCFIRVGPGLARFMVIIFPIVLGIVLYPTLWFYLSMDPGVVVLALLGTAIAFGGAAIFAFRSDKHIKTKMLFVILIAMVILGLLNALLFKMAIISLIISCVAVVLFTIYSFVDVQRIRQGGNGVMPEMAAFGVFLDIYNLFVSLLNIFGRFAR